MDKRDIIKCDHGMFIEAAKTVRNVSITLYNRVYTV